LRASVEGYDYFLQHVYASRLLV